MKDKIVTVSTSPNLALVKYWGKRRKGEECDDPSLNLPQNSSLSITLESGKDLFTKTSVVFSDKLPKDEFYLDGKKQDLEDQELQERFLAIKKLRELARVNTKALVASYNTFPTASGLASSASGLAALAFAASKALDLDISPERLSEIARIGSGRACRSLFGGFVVWDRGKKPDGSDSIARQLFNENYWPELTIFICITTPKKKKISSRLGMKNTVASSELFKLRPKIAESNIKQITEAIKKKDFEAMGKIIMKDAMNMHSTMLDTTPPIIYLNDISKDIIYSIEDLNESEKRVVGAYTFDAGPNACIICLESDKAKILSKMNEIKGIERIIEAKVGSGPKLLSESESLIDLKTLDPLKNKKSRYNVI